jgi:hypothetical protein
MSLWLAARVREMSLAIASWHATQTAAVASEQAGVHCLSPQQLQMQKP